MPFLGVRNPEVRRLTRAVVRGASAEALVATARALWDGAEFREERYAATEILGRPVLAGDWSLAPLHEHIARTGAWWDHVDETARRIADLHDAHPVETAALVRRWASDESFWINRLAILSQLGRRERTDVHLLTDVIGPHLGSREFFLRKAIGWALREYAKTDPDWVRAYVDATEMSPLSRREALKRLG
ncbi:DNA alkylation repair protein [Nocardioides baekrokdamisoli]|uniref:DNA alkylation repair protein n=2 Tax=Nocardioides baekrokdamisoli TaxID=1804624 RepID=A0A3G9J0Z5_9ACTN|nr:DNA alkylation repair protein [Nocardioides baekrokdamisoli]